MQLIYSRKELKLFFMSPYQMSLQSIPYSKPFQMTSDLTTVCPHSYNMGFLYMRHSVPCFHGNLKILVCISQCTRSRSVSYCTGSRSNSTGWQSLCHLKVFAVIQNIYEAYEAYTCGQKVTRPLSHETLSSNFFLKDLVQIKDK